MVLLGRAKLVLITLVICVQLTVLIYLLSTLSLATQRVRTSYLSGIRLSTLNVSEKASLICCFNLPVADSITIVFPHNSLVTKYVPKSMGIHAPADP